MRDLSIAASLLEAGVGAELEVEERDGAKRFGQVLALLGISRRLSSWASRRVLQFGVTEETETQEGVKKYPRLCFHEASVEGSSARRKKAASRIERYAVMVTEPLHEVMEESA